MFNNAGIMHPKDDDALSTEESVWDLTMDINVKGVWYGCKYAIIAMRKNGGGSVINTASFVAMMGAATPQLAYTASKGAVLAMTRELAMVHARENIRFNSLCPGPIRTPLLMDFLNTTEKKERRLVHVPQGRFGEAIEQAYGALFLASNESSYVTGTDFRVDGGLCSAYVTPEGKPNGPINEFIEYLNAEGIYLPEDGQPIAASIEEIDSDEEITEFNDDIEGSTNKLPNFPEVEQAIKEAIYEFEGAVFPKLNWTSPRDAAWISATQTLKCTSPFDVFLLLKSSDFINHDLNHAYENCVDAEEKKSDHEKSRFNLVLRKWYDLQPSMEFRCFVKDQEIIGITQRDLNHYPFLIDEKSNIEQSIYQFFEDVIRDEFESINYVFDVYIQRNRNKVYLVDFNPFSPSTDAILYDWNELISFDLDTIEPEIRLVESQQEANILSCNAPKFATNMIPKDVIDLSSGKSIAEFAEEFERAMRHAEEGYSSTSDEEE
ncbi:D123-domain-containing protein [Cokeromyces recurvatus]|uniref:D123-domain-containing protein n=1 Tax=Cokeromyces recurvatus TaxID=90255 RepID=UPI0022200ABE|nr:D123-domain-containing protein [Cokeromyces recurvatus]KAI7907667.1 D123-domain-containing protein [Cokeromyces recurvatus]